MYTREINRPVGLTLIATTVAALILSVQPAQPAQAASGSWGLFDASGGCGNAIRKLHVSPSKRVSIKRVISRAKRGHSLSVLDARPRRILFLDFNCRTGKSSVKLARIGSRVRVTTLRVPSSRIFKAAFDAKGRNAYVGWNGAGRINVRKLALPSGKVTKRHSWAGYGYLNDLDTANGRDLYLQVSSGSFSSATTRVLDWYDNDMYQLMAKKGNSFAHMSVASSGIVGLATNTAPSRVFTESWAGYPFSRVGLCNGGATTEFTWLAHRVALAGCSTDIGARRYQLLDLRGARPKRSWLGRFWGIQPVGLG